MESLDQFRHLEVHEKARNVFVMSLRLSDDKVLHNMSSLSGFSPFFRSYFVPLTSHLLDMRLVIANLALCALSAIYMQRGRVVRPLGLHAAAPGSNPVLTAG